MSWIATPSSGHLAMTMAEWAYIAWMSTVDHLLKQITKKMYFLRSNEGLCSFQSNLKIILDSSMDDQNKRTWIAILLEGFYQAIVCLSPFNKIFFELRLEIWHKHYGLPTITFLLTHERQIKKITNYFSIDSNSVKLTRPFSLQINPFKQLNYDHINKVLVNLDVLNRIGIPEEEKDGHLLKTYNDLGGFTMAPSDYYSKQFIGQSNKNAVLLEIGIGFGGASLQALDSGSRLFCNDIEPKNLCVLHNRYLKKNKKYLSLTGDYDNLIFLPGAFPEELTDLPKNSFDAILLSRVLHFFSGKKIEKCLNLVFDLLRNNGKIFITCETPFLKNWQRFIPEYEKRTIAGLEWPGEIHAPSSFETSGRSAALPDFFHLLTIDILERSLIRSNFKIEHISYIDRQGQFPEDIIWDGRESVGAIGVKCK